VFQTLLFMACCGQGSITLIAASNQSSVRVTARATNGPAGLLHVTQRERQIHPEAQTQPARGNVMPNHNEAPNPIPSPSEVMNRFGNEVLNNKNLSAIDEIAAEDYVELDLPPGQAPGREGLKAFLATVLFPAFPDQRWVTEEQITEGNKVVSRFTMYGTHRGDFMGISATGRSIAVKGVVIDRVVNGKWKESRLLMDNLSLLQQLGALPPAPPNNNATQRHRS
jgi:predicted ester cyclase